MRTAHNINGDGVTSVDKGETTKVIKSQIFSAKRKTSQTESGSSEIYSKTMQEHSRMRFRSRSSKTRILLKMVLLL